MRAAQAPPPPPEGTPDEIPQAPEDVHVIQELRRLSATQRRIESLLQSLSEEATASLAQLSCQVSEVTCKLDAVELGRASSKSHAVSWSEDGSTDGKDVVDTRHSQGHDPILEAPEFLPPVRRGSSRKHTAAAPPDLVETTASSQDGPLRPSMLQTLSHRWDLSRQGDAERNFEDDEASLSAGVMLPAGWPSTLECRYQKELLAEVEYHGASARNPHHMGHNRGSHDLAKSDTMPTVGGQEDWAHGASRFVIHPDSKFHRYLGVCSVCILVYDLVLIPYFIAWDLPVDGGILITAWVILAFWILDLFLGFVTGFYSKGELVMQRMAIARRYLSSWCMLDLVLVLCDILCIHTLTVGGDLNGPGTNDEMVTVETTARYLRMAGMLRIFKFWRIVEEYVETQLSEHVRLSLRLVFSLFVSLWVNHLMACTWLALGRVGPTDTGRRWTDTGNLVFWDQGRLYQYATAFHLSLSLNTMGSIEMSCINATERFFTVICLTNGLVVGSALISGLSATMVDLQMASKDTVQKLRTLRKFLKENPVDSRVARAVQVQIVQRLGVRERLNFDDVPALGMLSDSLRVELRLEMFRPQLCKHALFRLWHHIGGNVLRRFCVHGVESLFLRAEDDLFVPGPAKEHAYFFAEGAMTYSQDPSTSPVLHATTEVVEEESWLCEAALWSCWIHVGTARATTRAQMLVVRAAGITDVLKMRNIIRDITLQYAKLFFQRLLEASPPHMPWPDDLRVAGTDFPELMMSMEAHLQAVIGLSAIEHERRRGMRKESTEVMDRLEQEVSSGISIVMLDAAGEAQRIVAITVVRLEDQAGCILVEIGQLSAGRKLKPRCQLPGTKQERGQAAVAACRQVLEEDLRPFKMSAETVRIEKEVQTKESQKYGVCTKYLRTVFHMRAIDHEPLLPCPTGPPAEATASHDVGATPTVGRVASVAHNVKARPTIKATVGHSMGHIHSDGVRGRPSGSPILAELLVRPVYYLGSVDGGNFYCFLPPDMFDSLVKGGQHTDSLIQSWLQQLQPLYQTSV